MRLPIEDNQVLLLEYGRAHAYINQVDYLLGTFIDYQKRQQKMFKTTCEHQTLGQKIQHNQQYIPPALLIDLNYLNNKRKTMSHHGFIMLIEPQKNNRMRPTTTKGYKLDVISETDLKDMVKSSGKLIESIMKEFKK